MLAAAGPGAWPRASVPLRLLWEAWRRPARPAGSWAAAGPRARGLHRCLTRSVVPGARHVWRPRPCLGCLLPSSGQVSAALVLGDTASPRPGFSAPPSGGSGRLCPPRWDRPWGRRRSERFTCHVGRWKVESMRAPSGPPPDRHAAAPPRGSARPPGGGKCAATGPLSRAVLRGGPCPVPAQSQRARGVPASRSSLGHAVQASSPLPRWLLTLLSVSPRSLSSFSSHFCLVSSFVRILSGSLVGLDVVFLSLK